MLKKNSYAIPPKKNNNFFIKKDKYVELELIYKFPKGTLTLLNLKEHGLGQVQIQARVDSYLKSYIFDVKSKLVSKGGKN